MKRAIVGIIVTVVFAIVFSGQAVASNITTHLKASKSLSSPTLVESLLFTGKLTEYIIDSAIYANLFKATPGLSFDHIGLSGPCWDENKHFMVYLTGRLQPFTISESWLKSQNITSDNTLATGPNFNYDNAKIYFIVKAHLCFTVEVDYKVNANCYIGMYQATNGNDYWLIAIPGGRHLSSTNLYYKGDNFLNVDLILTGHPATIKICRTYVSCL